MTLLNGLFLTCLGLLAGLVYIILDGLHRAEEEADYLLAQIALEGRDLSGSHKKGTSDHSVSSGYIAHQQQAGSLFDDHSTSIYRALDSHGFFTINDRCSSSTQEVSCRVQSDAIPVADQDPSAQTARCA